MRPEVAADVLETIRPSTAAAMISMMDADQAADVIGVLEPAERTAVLAALDPQAAAEIQNLLVYAADSAGGMMTTDFASLPTGVSAGEAIEALRRLHDRLGSNISYVYVTDDLGATWTSIAAGLPDGRLLGYQDSQRFRAAAPGDTFSPLAIGARPVSQ